MNILFCAATYNRPLITQLSLSQIAGIMKKEDALWIWDDNSTEINQDILNEYTHHVTIKEKNQGIDAIRWGQLEAFLDTDYDLIYLFDNDALHDPSALKNAKLYYDGLYQDNGKHLPICLYNSKFHIPNTISSCGPMEIRKTAPGISMLLDKSMVKKIIKTYKQKRKKKSLKHNWDYYLVEWLNLYWICPSTSYVEHYGANGIHTKGNDFERDRAINPSHYLANTRPKVIEYLNQTKTLEVLQNDLINEDIIYSSD